MIAKRFILWALKRVEIDPYDYMFQRIVDSEGKVSIRRYMPFGDDDSKYIRYDDSTGTIYIQQPLPWYKPFNINLHQWVKSDCAQYHDHPRWSITIVLRGELHEHTPWGIKKLKPGSIVIRSPKYIHRFEVPKGHKGKTWTLFIVGRWKHLQHTYDIKPMYDGQTKIHQGRYK